MVKSFFISNRPKRSAHLFLSIQIALAHLFFSTDPKNMRSSTCESTRFQNSCGRLGCAPAGKTSSNTGERR